ncbi:MAG: hybrid sensor histidine kinase/response regulator, partial [Kangiellaceae bacterium]|nr:hybrid sensor histidine kinase/response regulator [Kangiellaceae bacterium]
TMRTDELHSTVKALEIAKQEAEKANQSKSRFLAAASHDLLQPFNAARLFAEMLKNESSEMSETQAELIKKTDQSLTVAENIIRSLVDISKLDSGTIHPKIRTIDIFDVVESIKRQFAGFAVKKNLKFKVHNRHALIKSDPELLHRVLQNFVSNAIRYTDLGGVLLAVRLRSNLVEVSVLDTGIGIRETDQKDIFNEFKRIADPKLKNTESGLGLGLSISERIAAILNHSINLKSVYEKGSNFSLTIKLSNQVLQTEKHSIVSSGKLLDVLAGVKALCVDNEQQIIDAMTMLLTRWQCDVRSAKSALEIEDILNEGFIPDIMLVDYQLDHGRTGLEFITEIRQKTGIEIPAIIVTANHSRELEEELKEQDIKLLHKPVKPAVLRATMSNELR